MLVKTICRSFLLALCACGAIACGEAPPPEYVWVRDPDSQVTLEIALLQVADKSVKVGQWIDLHAERGNGLWVRVAYDEISPDQQWLQQPPPAKEEGVEANVRWHVEPDGSAEFNLPTAQTLHVRRVRFSQPGNYTLWASTHSWDNSRVESNQLAIAVRP